MKVRCSSSYIKCTFEENEPFAGRTAIMDGEPSVEGFDAIWRSIEWYDDGNNGPISPVEKNTIRRTIEKYNITKGTFKITLYED
jgi:hypothetical protein